MTHWLTWSGVIRPPHLTWWHWAGSEWTGESGSSDGADYKYKLLCQHWPHLEKRTTQSWETIRTDSVLRSRSCWKIQDGLTVDDEGEVAIIESRGWDGDAPLVEAIVDPLTGSRRHIQDSLCRIIRAVADQVPVHHPLTVLQSVTGPHHPGTVAGQNGGRPCREGDVLGLHYHARPAATALTPCWHSKQTHGLRWSMQPWQEEAATHDLINTVHAGKKCLTARQEEYSKNWNRPKHERLELNPEAPKLDVLV